MKTILGIFALILLTGALVSLSGCTSEGNRNDQDNETISQDFDRERNELKDELRELRNDIDRELQKVNNRLERAANKDDQDLDADRVELEKANRDRLGAALRSSKEAAPEKAS